MTDPDFIPANSDSSQRSDPARNLAVVVYILQALSFFFSPVTALVGVIINYIKIDDVRGTWVEEHFRWQIRTFWFGLLWFVLFIVTFPPFSWAFLLGGAIWFIYRIVRGALALNDGKSPGR